MDPAQSKKEREETDASLRAERAKTDATLEEARTAVEKEADDVVAVARERAEATLHAARDRADREMTSEGAAPKVLIAVADDRATEDSAVAKEQRTADHVLAFERTARQHAVAELLRLEREATDDDLVAERARADEVVATRDDFLAMASHDLRSLLGGIAMSASLLATHAAPAGAAGTVTLRHAERIRRFTARMNLLVADLLDVVSLEAGQLHVSPKPGDAVQLVREALDAFGESFAAKGVTLSFDDHASPDSVLASFDHDRILQVLANLLGNALKFTPAGGNVSLRVARAGEDVRFSVRDNGVGIPSDQALVIFERFRQVIAKDRRGLGLGLYIAKCIVDAHGGRIWADQADAGGAALHFTIPVAGPPPATD
jgi:signal transduction histidine kinase